MKNRSKFFIFKNLQVKYKIILPIILTAAIVLSAATFYSYSYNLKILKSVINDHLETAVSSRAHHVDTFLNEQKNKIELMASSMIFKKVFNGDLENYEINLENACARTTKVVEVDKTIYELFLLDLDGKIICSSNKESIGLDKSNDDYFINGLKKTHIKDVYYSESTGKTSIAISSPVTCDTDGCIGVMVARMETTILNTILQDRTGLGETGEIYVINKDGFAITPLRLREGRFLNYKIHSEGAKSCLSTLEQQEQGGDLSSHLSSEYLNHEPTIAYADYRDVDVLGSYHISDVINWCLLAEFDESEALASARDLLKFSIIRVLVVIFIFFIITYLLAKLISRPINDLRRGTEIIEKGNLNYKVSIDSKDEIGQLSRSFDKMTESIQKSRTEIDRRVEKQTEEIVLKESNMKDQQKAILNILEDIDEEKGVVISERNKINKILQSIGDGVFVVDRSLSLTVFNQIAADISGYSIKESIGKKYSEVLNFVFEKDGKINDRFIKNAIKTGEIQEMTNHTELIRKDGTKVSVADSAAPLKDKDGKIIGCVVVFRDVNQERLVDRAKTEFVSLASHQLRTPLSTISWYAEMLLAGDAGKINENQKKYLEEIYKGNKRMVELVNSLLNVSRLELGTFMIEPKKIKIGELLEEIVKDLKPLIISKKLKFTKSLSKKLPETYLADIKLLRMVLHNLLSNAIKYTPEKGLVGIRVGIDNKKIYFEITDTGYGIPKNQESKIFEKLFRADNIRAMDTEGTGLGLYIVKSIIDSVGGEISFKSQVNKGTVFCVELPLSGMRKKGGTKSLN